MTRSREEGSTSNTELDSVPGRRDRIRAILGHRDLLACVIILTGASVVFIPIYLRGFPAGTDAGFHFRWVNQLSEALREPGVFYPRWLGSANNGQGSPVMLYYPPLTIFVAACVKILAGDTLTALTLSCWIGLVASGLAMYTFCRSVLSPWPSLFAALLYLIAPYHLFDLYHGSVLAEFWSFAWLPLVLDAVHRIARGGGWRPVMYLGVSYALLLLTHVPVSFAVTLILPFYIVLLTRQPRHLLRILAGLVFGIALSSIFILPVVFERGFVRLPALLVFDYQDFFLFQNLLAAKESLLMRDLSIYRDPIALKPDRYLYLLQTDQVAMGLAALFVVASALVLLRWRSVRSPFRSGLIRAALVVAALSLLMTTKYSAVIWRSVPQLPYMQFPSRFLVISTAAVSFLGGAVASTLQRRSLASVLSAVVLGVAVGFNLLLSGFAILREPIDPTTFRPDVLRREVPEYRPVWWNGKLHDDEILPPLVISDGEASATVIDDHGTAQSYAVEANTATTIKFRTLYFPGWTARIDGRLAELGPSEEGSIQVRMEPGRHLVALNFEDTSPRRAGKLISFAGLLALIAIWIRLGLLSIRSRAARGALKKKDGQ